MLSGALPERQYFVLHDFELQSGTIMPKMILAYRVFGSLSPKADNVILFPTYYTGSDKSNAALIGPGKTFDTNHYCVVVPNLFGNGVSSSPSNTSPPFDGSRFPLVSIFDNVCAQHELLSSLNINQLQLVVGWSMGAVQTYQWACQFPSQVKRALAICGTAKTSLHNQVFLRGVSSALKADPIYAHGDYKTQPAEGLKAFGRVYCGWAYSQAFFRNERFKELGFESVDALLEDWERDHLEWDANDLLAMLETWFSADISQQPLYQGNMSSALSAISAEFWLMPCEQDLYFRHEENRIELKQLKNGRYCGYESDFGHCSAGPGRIAGVTQLITEKVNALLNR